MSAPGDSGQSFLLRGQDGSVGVVVPSKQALQMHNDLMGKSSEEIARDYVDLPLIPSDQELLVEKIGRVVDWVKYKDLRKLRPDDYCAGGANPTADYMDDETVDLITVTVDGVQHRAHPSSWFPLADIVQMVGERQGRTGVKVFPSKMVFKDGSVGFVEPFQP